MTSLTLTASPVAQSECMWLLATATTSPSMARRHVTEQLNAWNLKTLISDVALIVSELVTNAISHGRGPVRHSLRLMPRPDSRPSLRVEVVDRGAGWDGPAPRTPIADADSCRGRGLHLVDALATEWGHEVLNDGHAVWAEVPLPADS